jgi:hypothetical protein
MTTGNQRTIHGGFNGEIIELNVELSIAMLVKALSSSL